MKLIYFSVLFFFVCSCASLHIEKRRFKKGYFVSIDRKNKSTNNFVKDTIEIKESSDFSLKVKTESYKNSSGDPLALERESKDFISPEDSVLVSETEFQAIKGQSKIKKGLFQYMENNILNPAINQEEKDVELPDDEINTADYVGVAVGVLVLPLAIFALIFSYILAANNYDKIENDYVRIFLICNTLASALLGFCLLYYNIFKKFLSHFSFSWRWEWTIEKVYFNLAVLVGFLLSMLVYALIIVALL